jgi:hypothetical protein
MVDPNHAVIVLTILAAFALFAGLPFVRADVHVPIGERARRAGYDVHSILVAMPSSLRDRVAGTTGASLPAMIEAIEAGAPAAYARERARTRNEARWIARRHADALSVGRELRTVRSYREVEVRSLARRGPGYIVAVCVVATPADGTRGAGDLTEAIRRLASTGYVFAVGSFACAPRDSQCAFDEAALHDAFPELDASC